VADTQGWPVALKWAYVRGDLGLDPMWVRGVYYFRAETDHNIDGTTLKVRVMEIWLDALLAGMLR
jgi:hypothetical protein